MVAVALCITLVIAIMGAILILLRQPLTVQVWIHGGGITWEMGFAVHWLGFAMGDSWQIPRSPAAQSQPGMSFDPKRIRKGWHVLRWYRRFVEVLWRRCQVTKFSVDAEVGLSDASDTGLVCGMVAGGIGWWLTHRIHPQAVTPPVMDVEPVWDHAAFAGHLKGEFSVEPRAILASLFESLAIKRVSVNNQLYKEG
ncbi:MAG: DUF2953 domain-containing protein [Firmicutes bacterium]|jgi:hypothetical protein|nr:DUF2953 domain-containing protein [Bacillota bacterium]MCL5971713.1 DUF2953 domain-containing protein [Bacillota bacterium]